MIRKDYKFETLHSRSERRSIDSYVLNHMDLDRAK